MCKGILKNLLLLRRPGNARGIKKQTEPADEQEVRAVITRQKGRAE